MTNGTRALQRVAALAKSLGCKEYCESCEVFHDYPSPKDKHERLEAGLNELTRKVNALADALGIRFEEQDARPPRTVARFILKEKGATDGPVRKRSGK